MKSLPLWLRESCRLSFMTVGALALVLQVMALLGMPSQMNYLAFFAVYFSFSALAASLRAKSSQTSTTHS
ncbi:hypothetical protein [Jeongeupia sp. HS-3]|uniref:hypothetical protein n=1 Tax=Jeongeupia sp. HS-3 TaxID=1009682 RepID=UPI0019103ADF|nr:hypothetical protein [Jeongeupia sp. HS-3]